MWINSIWEGWSGIVSIQPPHLLYSIFGRCRNHERVCTWCFCLLNLRLIIALKLAIIYFLRCFSNHASVHGMFHRWLIIQYLNWTVRDSLNWFSISYNIFSTFSMVPWDDIWQDWASPLFCQINRSILGPFNKLIWDFESFLGRLDFANEVFGS